MLYLHYANNLNLLPMQTLSLFITCLARNKIIGTNKLLTLDLYGRFSGEEGLDIFRVRSYRYWQADLHRLTIL